jgi:hypothetical protein
MLASPSSSSPGSAQVMEITGGKRLEASSRRISPRNSDRCKSVMVLVNCCKSVMLAALLDWGACTPDMSVISRSCWKVDVVAVGGDAKRTRARLLESDDAWVPVVRDRAIMAASACSMVRVNVWVVVGVSARCRRWACCHGGAISVRVADAVMLTAPQTVC